MGFVSEVAKKLGLPYKEATPDQAEQQQAHSYDSLQPAGPRPNANLPNLMDAASRMDIDSNRQLPV